MHTGSARSTPALRCGPHRVRPKARRWARPVPFFAQSCGQGDWPPQSAERSTLSANTETVRPPAVRPLPALVGGRRPRPAGTPPCRAASGPSVSPPHRGPRRPPSPQRITACPFHVHLVTVRLSATPCPDSGPVGCRRPYSQTPPFQRVLPGMPACPCEERVLAGV